MPQLKPPSQLFLNGCGDTQNVGANGVYVPTSVVSEVHASGLRIAPNPSSAAVAVILDLDGPGMASGVYLLRLRQADSQKTLRLVRMQAAGIAESISLKRQSLDLRDFRTLPRHIRTYAKPV